MRRIAIATATLALAACVQQSSGREPERDYVDVVHPPAPAGVQHIASGIVRPSDGFAVSHVRDSVGEMLWLDRRVDQSPRDRVAHWKVVDVERLPHQVSDETIVYGYCRVGDVSRGGGDGRTYAIARYEAKEILTDVRHAWRIDTAKGRIVPIPTDGVQCINEGWGV